MSAKNYRETHALLPLTAIVIILVITIPSIIHASHAIECMEKKEAIYKIYNNLKNGTILSLNCSSGYITLKVAFKTDCPNKAIITGILINTTLLPLYEGRNKTHCIEEFTTKGVSFIRIKPGENITISFPRHGSILVKYVELMNANHNSSKTPKEVVEGGNNTETVYTPEELDESKSQDLINKMPGWSTPLLETIALAVSAGLTILSAVKEYGQNRKSDGGPRRGNPGTDIRQ